VIGYRLEDQCLIPARTHPSSCYRIQAKCRSHPRVPEVLSPGAKWPAITHHLRTTLKFLEFYLRSSIRLLGVVLKLGNNLVFTLEYTPDTFSQRNSSFRTLVLRDVVVKLMIQCWKKWAWNISGRSDWTLHSDERLPVHEVPTYKERDASSSEVWNETSY
jgi:hypothetical protein